MESKMRCSRQNKAIFGTGKLHSASGLEDHTCKHLSAIPGDTWSREGLGVVQWEVDYSVSMSASFIDWLTKKFLLSLPLANVAPHRWESSGWIGRLMWMLVQCVPYEWERQGGKPRMWPIYPSLRWGDRPHLNGCLDYQFRETSLSLIERRKKTAKTARTCHLTHSCHLKWNIWMDVWPVARFLGAKEKACPIVLNWQLP